MGSHEMVNLLPRCDKNDHFGSGNGNFFLSHLGNRIYHFIGSNSLVVYYVPVPSCCL